MIFGIECIRSAWVILAREFRQARQEGFVFKINNRMAIVWSLAA